MVVYIGHFCPNKTKKKKCSSNENAKVDEWIYKTSLGTNVYERKLH